MLSLPSAQVKGLLLILGLTRDYTVKHTMLSNCIECEDGRSVPGWSCYETANGRCGAPAVHGAADPP
jgi:hypothetical protein